VCTQLSPFSWRKKRLRGSSVNAAQLSCACGDHRLLLLCLSRLNAMRTGQDSLGVASAEGQLEMGSVHETRQLLRVVASCQP
jgi:hypothetical protein